MRETLTIDLGSGITPDCGSDCPEFVGTWFAWFDVKSRAAPFAIADCDRYYERLRQKSRHMVRQANLRYNYREFAYNDQLDQMHEVNISKSFRQGRPMSKTYRDPLTPISRPLDLCSVHRDTWFGAFEQDGTLAGYCRLEKLNELGILNTILGRAGSTGAINGLMAHVAAVAEVRWINYLHMASSTDSLSAFKERIGFRAVWCRRTPKWESPVDPGGHASVGRG